MKGPRFRKIALCVLAASLFFCCQSTKNIPVPEGSTPLHVAVKNKDQGAMKALLEKGADPLARDKDGKSALDYAEELGGGLGIDNALLALCLGFVIPEITIGGGDDLERNVSAFSISADGKRYAIGYNGEARVFAYPEGQLRFSLACESKWYWNHVFSIDFSPDGKWVATGSEDGLARVWDANTGALKYSLENFEKGENSLGVYTVSFSPDSRLLASASDKGVWLWDISSGKQSRKFSVDDEYENSSYAATFSPNGKLLFVRDQGGLAAYDVEKGSLAGTVKNEATVYASLESPIVSADGKTVFFLAGGSLYTGDCVSWKVTKQSELPESFAKSFYQNPNGGLASYSNTCSLFSNSERSLYGVFLDWSEARLPIWDLGARELSATVYFYLGDVLLIRGEKGSIQSIPESALSAVVICTVAGKAYDSLFFKGPYFDRSLFPSARGLRTILAVPGYGG